MKRNQRDLTIGLSCVLLAIMGILVLTALEAQPGKAGPRAIAPAPSIRSVVVEQAPGDSVDVTATWGAGIVRPGGTVAELHVLDVFDADTVRFLVTDSVPASEASGTTLASTLRVPADTVNIPARACVQAHHSGLSSAQRCSDFTIDARMLLEDPTAPDVQVEIDSIAVLPDSATLAVGDSMQFTAWLYSGGAVVGCSGNCVESATVPMSPVHLASDGKAFYLRWANDAEVPPPHVTGPTWIENYDAGLYDRRYPLLAALWRQKIERS